MRARWARSQRSGARAKGPFSGVAPITSSAISCAGAALMTLPAAALTFSDEVPGLRAVLSVVALGVVGTALAFVILYGLIAEICAGRASLVSYLAPGVALFYGAVFLDEAVGVAAVTGLVLILGGVAVAGRRSAVAVPESVAGHTNPPK